MTASGRSTHLKIECEEKTLLAAKAGSHDAFDVLQQTYSNQIYQRILSITRNREEAEDALQDTFFRAYRALTTFEGRAKFSTWLTRIAINSALITLRKRRARASLSYEFLEIFEDGSTFSDVRDSALNPEQLCDQNQRSEAIANAIRQLDPKLRIPLDIWLSEEQSMKDLAQQLGVSLASVKARLHRARQRLKRCPALRNHKLNGESQCLDNDLTRPLLDCPTYRHGMSLQSLRR
jgi:RNA polymerase sigma-70 factor (ECF subfamily)